MGNDDFLARRNDNLLGQDVLAAMQPKTETDRRIQIEALEAFSRMNPPSAVCAFTADSAVPATLSVLERDLRNRVDVFVTNLAADTILTPEQVDVVSEELYRRLQDIQTHADAIIALVPKLQNIDMVKIIERHYGEIRGD